MKGSTETTSVSSGDEYRYLENYSGNAIDLPVHADNTKFHKYWDVDL